MHRNLCKKQVLSMMTQKETRKFSLNFLRIAGFLALQNILTYAVNILDNLMLGAYSQAALSGAAVVNQIQFIVQQFTVAGLAEGLVIFAGQFWGKRDRTSVYKITVCSMICGITVGMTLMIVTGLVPERIIDIFLEDETIRDQSLQYLAIVRYSYLPFIVTSLMLACLRTMRSVRIGVTVSVVALLVNVGLNYMLIFGKLGFPVMGIQGAALGTLAARIVEFFVVVCFFVYSQKGGLSRGNLLPDGKKMKAYLLLSTPCVVSALLFSCASAVHTAIFGHISADVLAASSVSATLYQFFKMIPVSMVSAAGVLISASVGVGDAALIQDRTKILQKWFVPIGVVFAALLLILSRSFAGAYALSPAAYQLSCNMLIVQSVAFVGMSYQMPCQLGIIRSGGDTRYSMISDVIYSWLYVVPLGLLATFLWKWPVEAVCFCLYSDQLFKCITVGWKTNHYTWIRELTE